MERVAHYRRKDLRIPYRGTVRFSADQFNWYVNRAENISKKGIFIATEAVFREGTRLYLNFDLTLGSEVVKKIRTTGRVARLAAGEGTSSDGGGSGIGIRFSLLSGEREAVHSFSEDSAGGYAADGIPAGQSKARHVLMEVEDTGDSPLRWWFREAVNRVYGTNGVILELLVLLVFIMLGVVFFL